MIVVVVEVAAVVVLEVVVTAVVEVVRNAGSWELK